MSEVGGVRLEFGGCRGGARGRVRLASEVASWVQAGGSIVAIGAGFAYHAWQVNMALRRKLQVAIDAVNEISRELRQAQDGTRVDFPDFDTTRLVLIADCLEEEAKGSGTPFEVRLTIMTIVRHVRTYASQWDSDTGDLRDTLNRSFDVMDMDGALGTALSQAETGLRGRLGQLRLCPLRMY